MHVTHNQLSGACVIVHVRPDRASIARPAPSKSVFSSCQSINAKQAQLEARPPAPLATPSTCSLPDLQLTASPLRASRQPCSRRESRTNCARCHCTKSGTAPVFRHTSTQRQRWLDKPPIHVSGRHCCAVFGNVDGWQKAAALALWHSSTRPSSTRTHDKTTSPPPTSPSAIHRGLGRPCPCPPRASALPPV